MIVLRNKLFGKLDAKEAKRLGKTVAELRQMRASLGKSTGTVHDSINLRSHVQKRSKYYTPEHVNEKLLEGATKNGKLIKNRIRRRAEEGVISESVAEMNNVASRQLGNSMRSKYKNKY